MRLVVFGAPAFSVPTLEAVLAAGHEVAAVVTQPDRPAGRGHASTPPLLKVAALKHGLRVLQPANVSDPESVAVLRSLEPDALVVAAYGQILRQRVLDVPKRGSLNVHASLLPRHRGASPVAAAIIAGDRVTGVTIMEMVRALDAGPILARAEEPIRAEDTTGTLEARLAQAGANLLCQTLEPWARGEIVPEPQDESQATYAPMIKREDARIDWTMSAVDIWRRVRAYNPWPIAFTTWQGQELRIFAAWPLDDAERGSAEPGTVLQPQHLPASSGTSEIAISVQTGEGRLAVLRLQRAGRRQVSAAEFLNGTRGFIGSKLGT